MPELSNEQIAAFRVVTPEEHARFASGKVRPRGRPKKSAAEKERPISIRMSASLIARLKKRAAAAGFDKWQTYAKKVLADDLESSVVH